MIEGGAAARGGDGEAPNAKTRRSTRGAAVRCGQAPQPPARQRCPRPAPCALPVQRLALKPSACSSGLVSSMMALMAAASAWPPSSSGSSSLRSGGRGPGQLPPQACLPGRPGSVLAGFGPCAGRAPGACWPWWGLERLLACSQCACMLHPNSRTRRALAGRRRAGLAAAAGRAPAAPPPRRCRPTDPCPRSEQHRRRACK